MKRNFRNSLGSSSSVSKNWNGDWFIYERTHSYFWGNFKAEYPENDPDELIYKSRDFELDLSGIRIDLILIVVKKHISYQGNFIELRERSFFI